MDSENTIDNFMAKYKYPLVVGLVGLVLLIGGLVSSGLLQKTFIKKPQYPASTSVQNPLMVAVDVSGAVVNPGVYQLPNGARVEEAIRAAGGVTESADLNYLSKSMNLAQKIVDGMKVYIPRARETGPSGQPVLGIQTQDSLININSASVSELDKLPGVGPVTAQNIIDKRPYSEVSELLSKKAVSKAVYEKIKGLVSVY